MLRKESLSHGVTVLRCKNESLLFKDENGKLSFEQNKQVRLITVAVSYLINS